MNIEESIDNVKFIIGDLKASNYNQIFIQAIEILLTAYEKEKETSHYNQSQLDIANAKLVEEKEKNKDLKEGYKIQEHNYQVAME